MSSHRQLIETYVGSKVQRLQSGYAKRASYALAGLAALRQVGLSKPGDNPKAWGLLYEGLPEELFSSSTEASRAENAIQGALVLFANHQASRSDPMHRQGTPVGAAVGMLARARAGGDDLDAAVLARFQTAASSHSHGSRVRLLQQLVSMMRAERSPSIGLDYGDLASDLYTLQFADRAPDIRLAWGRQVHRRTSVSETPETSTNQTEEN